MNLLITVEKSYFSELLDLSDNTDGYLSNRSPNSIQIPEEQARLLIDTMRAKSVSFEIKSINPSGDLSPYLGYLPEPNPLPNPLPNPRKRRLGSELTTHTALGETEPKLSPYLLPEPSPLPKPRKRRLRCELTTHTAFGEPEPKLISEWAKDYRCIVNASTLHKRIARGWAVEKALTTPPAIEYTAFHESKSLPAWRRDPRCKASETAILRRINEGWDVEAAIATPARVQSYEAFGEAKSPKEWERDPRCKAPFKAVRSRLRVGWDIERALSTPVSPHRVRTMAKCPRCEAKGYCIETRQLNQSKYKGVLRRLECVQCRQIFEDISGR